VVAVVFGTRRSSRSRYSPAAGRIAGSPRPETVADAVRAMAKPFESMSPKYITLASPSCPCCSTALRGSQSENPARPPTYYSPIAAHQAPRCRARATARSLHLRRFRRPNLAARTPGQVQSQHLMDVTSVTGERRAGSTLSGRVQSIRHPFVGRRSTRRDMHQSEERTRSRAPTEETALHVACSEKSIWITSARGEGFRLAVRS
jgi:hypothetical protein